MFNTHDQTIADKNKGQKWYRSWRVALTIVVLAFVVPVISSCSYFEHDRDMSMVFAKHVDKRLATLHDRLKITAEQTPQWDKFAAAVKTEGQIVADRHRDLMLKSKSEASQGNAIGQLEAFQTMMEANMISMKKVIETAKPLYAVMNTEQKKIADKMVMNPRMGWREHFKESKYKEEKHKEGKHKEGHDEAHEYRSGKYYHE